MQLLPRDSNISLCVFVCSVSACRADRDRGSQGKSLSVICSALQWLKDAEARDVDGSFKAATKPAENGASCSTSTLWKKWVNLD